MEGSRCRGLRRISYVLFAIAVSGCAADQNEAKPAPTAEHPLLAAAETGTPADIDRMLAADPACIHAVDGRGLLPLHRAARRGRDEIVARLLAAGAGIDRADKDGRTPLHLAIAADRRSTAALLLDSGADCEAGGAAGTALHAAIRASRMEMIRLLIANGANVHAPSPDRRESPLHIAAADNRSDIVELLIAAGADIDNNHGPNRITPLLAALSLNRTGSARTLIERGADVMLRDKRGRTPLHLAAANGNLELTVLLLDHGADPNAWERAGDTPFGLAVFGGHRQVAEALFGRGADIEARQYEARWTPLYYANEKCDVGMFRWLLGSGADLSAKSSYGQDLLITAVRLGCEDLTTELLRRKYPADVRNTVGLTGLQVAAQRGQTGLISLFIAADADVNFQWYGEPEKRFYGYSPLLAALSCGHADAAITLIGAGADVTLTTPDGQSATDLARKHCPNRPDLWRLIKQRQPAFQRQQRERERVAALHAAVTSGDEDRINRILAEDPAAMNRPGADGYSALSVAVNAGNLPLLNRLLAAGAEVNVQTPQGASPLHLAKRADLAAALLDRGAEIDATTARDRTALFGALGSRNMELVELLLRRGAGIDRQDTFGTTPLLLAFQTAIAAKSDPRVLVELLLRTSAERDLALTARLPAGMQAAAAAWRMRLRVRTKDWWGQSLLHMAAAAGDPQILAWLIDAGADIEARDVESGSTPLIVAAEVNQAASVKVLLDRGADPNARNWDGNSPLELADPVDGRAVKDLLSARGV